MQNVVGFFMIFNELRANNNILTVCVFVSD